VTGRWPGRHGLELKRVSDRVRLHVPGTFSSVTLLAWARVEALPNVNNALFMTDGWDAGGLHWQNKIRDDEAQKRRPGRAGPGAAGRHAEGDDGP
jgi:hypothetical protein